MIAGCGTDDVATLNCIFPLIATITLWSLMFASVVATFFIVFGGIRIITSGGDAKTLDTGKKTLTYAILGLVVIFSSFMIMSFISYVTGVACIDPKNGMSFTSCK